MLSNSLPASNRISTGRHDAQWINKPWMRSEVLVSAVVIGLAVVGLGFLSFAYWHAFDASAKVQSIEQIHQRQQEIVDAIRSIKTQQDVVRDQNQWSIEDRRRLHQSQQEISDSLKRLESRK